MPIIIIQGKSQRMLKNIVSNDYLKKIQNRSYH